MNKKFKMFLAIVICFLTLGSGIYVVNMIVLKSTSDVLIVQIGDDDAIDETTDLISNNFERRNKDITLGADDDRESNLETNKLDSLYGTSDVCLGQLDSLFMGEFLLDVDVIKVDISDLKNNILDKYHSKILIVVGHGSKKGIEDKNDYMEWDNVEELIKENSAHFTILTACYSDNAAKDLPNAFGFPSIIDAIVAAHITSALIFKMLGEVSYTNDAMELALERYLEIQEDPESMMPLALVPTETVYWIFIVICTVCAILLNFWMDTTFFKQIAIKFAVYGGYRILIALYSYALGIISLGSLIATFFCFVLSFISALISAIFALFSYNFWYALFMWIYFGAVLALFLVQLACSGSTIFAIKLAAVIIPFIGIGLGIYNDVLD